MSAKRTHKHKVPIVLYPDTILFYVTVKHCLVSRLSEPCSSTSIVLQSKSRHAQLIKWQHPGYSVTTRVCSCINGEAGNGTCVRACVRVIIYSRLFHRKALE